MRGGQAHRSHGRWQLPAAIADVHLSHQLGDVGCFWARAHPRHRKREAQRGEDRWNARSSVTAGIRTSAFVTSIRSRSDMSTDMPAPTAQAKLPDGVKGLIAGLGGVAVAVITLLTAFNVVNWSNSQTALATAEAAAVVAFLTAVVAHVWHGTKQEPVALGGTFTALVAATLALMSGFSVWTLT